MVAQVKRHYEDVVLQRLLNDQLPLPQRCDIAEHLESCPTCQTQLETLSQSDISWSEVREFLGQPEIEHNTPEFPKHGTRMAHANDGLEFLNVHSVPGNAGRNHSTQFGRYEIKEVLGRGGMGVVLKAYDPALERHSAIKILAPEFASNASARKRFHREAKSAAAVVHEHVVPIQTVDEHDGLPYLVMPVIEGPSLQQRVHEQGYLELEEILRIGMQVASGLAAAHKQGLVHRDVKPANILLEEGVERVMISDFGLARAADEANMTRSQVISGTPQYMSPEQARGNEIDHRSDLFSLGSVLYFMCCGHSPFRAETTVGVLHRIVNDRPRRIQAINPAIPRWLESIIFRLLHKEAAQRFSSADEVASLLERWLAHVQQPGQVAAPTRTRSGHFGESANWWKRCLTALAFAAVLFLGVIVVLETNKGTITIESKHPDAIVRIKKNDRVVRELTISQGQASTRIAAGDYLIEVEGEVDNLEVENHRVTLNRGGTWIARVTEDPGDGPTPENSPDESLGRTPQESPPELSRSESPGLDPALNEIWHFGIRLQSQSEWDEKRRDAVAKAWFEMGTKHLKDGNLEESHKWFSELVNRDPHGRYAEDAMFYIGVANVAMGKYEEGIQILESVIQFFPDGRYRSDSRFLLGQVLLKLGRTDEAKHVIEQATELDPRIDMSLDSALWRQILDTRKDPRSDK